MGILEIRWDVLQLWLQVVVQVLGYSFCGAIDSANYGSEFLGGFVQFFKEINALCSGFGCWCQEF